MSCVEDKEGHTSTSDWAPKCSHFGAGENIESLVKITGRLRTCAQGTGPGQNPKLDALPT